MIAVQTRDYDGKQVGIAIDRQPDTCPFCHKSISPRMWADAGLMRGEWVQIPFICPARNCQSMFVGYYTRNDRSYVLTGTSKGTKKFAAFSDVISNELL